MTEPHTLKRFAVVDLETTGLSPHTEQIIEVGAIFVDIETGDYDAFSRFVACERPLSSRITKITGITDEMLKDAQAVDLVLDDLAHFIRGRPIVAYNAGFDMSFLRAAARNQAFDKCQVVCALQAARRYLKLPNHKLATVAAHFGIEQKQAHRALDDCLTTLSVFQHIRKISEQRHLKAN